MNTQVGCALDMQALKTASEIANIPLEKYHALVYQYLLCKKKKREEREKEDYISKIPRELIEQFIFPHLEHHGDIVRFGITSSHFAQTLGKNIYKNILMQYFYPLFSYSFFEKLDDHLVKAGSYATLFFLCKEIKKLVIHRAYNCDYECALYAKRFVSLFLKSPLRDTSLMWEILFQHSTGEECSPQTFPCRYAFPKFSLFVHSVIKFLACHGLVEEIVYINEFCPLPELLVPFRATAFFQLCMGPEERKVFAKALELTGHLIKEKTEEGEVCKVSAKNGEDVEIIILNAGETFKPYRKKDEKEIFEKCLSISVKMEGEAGRKLFPSIFDALNKTQVEQGKAIAFYKSKKEDKIAKSLYCSTQSSHVRDLLENDDMSNTPLDGSRYGEEDNFNEVIENVIEEVKFLEDFDRWRKSERQHIEEDEDVFLNDREDEEEDTYDDEEIEAELDRSEKEMMERWCAGNYGDN